MLRYVQKGALMDTQPHLDDPLDDARDDPLQAWLASESFTDFMTLTFGAAVKHAVEEQLAKGVSEGR
jgi:hypothetical protein